MSLPCRALPFRALLLIREYSQPITRPNWRKSKPIITTYHLYLEVRNASLYIRDEPKRKVDYIIFRNIKSKHELTSI
jgi:hypothetical protein